VGETVIFSSNGDGSYTADFANTSVNGIYTVAFDVKGERPDIGVYRRTEILSTFVRFSKAEWSTSELYVTRQTATTEQPNMLLHIRPKDLFGNFLGPDYGTAIRVTLSTGTVSNKIEDELNGAYTVPLSIADGTEPDVSVYVLEKPVYVGPLSGIIREPHRFTLSLHGGRTFPLEDFDNTVDAGILAEIDLEYSLYKHLSLEAVLGHYSFDPEYEIGSGTLYLKGYVPIDVWRLFAAGGAGVYKPENTNTSLGLSVGIGLNRELIQNVQAVGGIYYFHLFTPGTDIDFEAAKIGFRYTF
jgi:hypothetical protein